MPSEVRYALKSLDDLKELMQVTGIGLPLSENTAILAKPVNIGPKTAPNAMVVLPMEGWDGHPETGAPEALTFRRYERYAAGGSGLIWFEATAVVFEGRSNPRQMVITKDNADAYRRIVDAMHKAAEDHGFERPVILLQLTHSGRYSRPSGDIASPVIVQNDPLLNKSQGIAENMPLVGDDYLDALQEKYAEAAALAVEAGFDGVDVKACHRYLLSEMLAARMRPGKYGGSFANRTRFYLETIARVRETVGTNAIVGTRLNIYDRHPYPYGFGVDEHDYLKPDLTEPLALIQKLVAAGIDIISVTASWPYYKHNYLTCPRDAKPTDEDRAIVNPLENIRLLLDLTKAVKAVAGDIPVAGTGFSWLREYSHYVGAGCLEAGDFDFFGYGRAAFAYPDAPADIVAGGVLNKGKVCTTCGLCSEIMGNKWQEVGCPVRDRDIYAERLQQSRAYKKQLEQERGGTS